MSLCKCAYVASVIMRWLWRVNAAGHIRDMLLSMQVTKWITPIENRLLMDPQHLNFRD